MKTCTKCKENKELEEFGNNKRNKDGKQGQCKECRNAAQNTNRSTPEGAAKARAYTKAYTSTPEGKAKHKAAIKKWRATPEAKAKVKTYRATIENKAKDKAYRETPEVRAKKKARDEAKKQERIENLIKNFNKLKSEVSGTIYHFEINGVYKIGKSVNGFDSRYKNQVQEEATQVTEWVMNEEQMHTFEKIILEKTKEFQYIGDDVLPCTGNREIRTNDNEQLIDDLLADLNVNFVKLKR